MRGFRAFTALCLALVLAACGGGGGDSSTTTVTGAGLNNLGQSPAVSTLAMQTDNNLLVSVSDGPRGFQLAPNANILYATVKVCSPVDGRCVDIDHVQVDTGSVGLRVLASKVKTLALPPVEIDTGPVRNAYECFPFVIGGLWGANAMAVVGLGRQSTGIVAVQLIEDDPAAPLQATPDCRAAADNAILSSAGALGSNGILGIGSTNLDCGQICLTGSYAANATFVQYYGCPPAATSSAACSTSTGVAANLQVSNPISAMLNSAYRNGVVLAMPTPGVLGAVSASGELVFGVDTVSGGPSLSSNMLPANATRVMLGIDPNQMDSYLNIGTRITQGGSLQTFASSYLDTGTNGLFFTDPSIPRCAGSTWYCPRTALTLGAELLDGGSTAQSQVSVQFQVGNAEALFSTSNSAFSNAAGAAPTGSTAFAWGMPFFYGRRVYLSIWDIACESSHSCPVPAMLPWYAWTAL
jgi:hypothetical protein